MKITAMRTGYDADMNVQATFTFSGNAKQILTWLAGIAKLLADDKPVEMILRAFKKVRSRSANNYAWQLMSQIADALRASKEDVYNIMLTRYGQREQTDEPVVVRVDAYSTLYRATHAHVCIVDVKYLDTGTYYEIAFLRGSSDYDTREMSILIDGVISECKDMGIETATPAELERMKGEWGR